MKEDNVIQTPPNSIEAERSFLGSILLNPEIMEDIGDLVRPEDFYNPLNKLIYEKMIMLQNEKVSIDVTTLADKLKNENFEIKQEDLISIANYVPTSINYKDYASIIQQKALLRRLISASNKIQEKCYKGDKTTEEIVEDAEKLIFEIAQNKPSEDFEPISEIINRVLDNISKAMEYRGALRGLPTGFTDLDAVMSGLQSEDFILIAARPAMGKTAFVLNIAQYVATHVKDKTTAIFSLEMSKEQLLNRLLAISANVEAKKITEGNLSDDDFMEITNKAVELGETNLIIDDSSGITISELKRKCRKYKMDHNLGLVIIDYLQLMTGNGKENRQQEISEISRSLKILAKELKVPVIALSQLSRAVEQRPSKRPMLSDLRESGAIEQDADIVMFIYRDDYYNPETEKKNVAEIIIAKHRNGPLATVELSWIPSYTKFANLEKMPINI